MGKNEELTKSGTWGRSPYNYAHEIHYLIKVFLGVAVLNA